MGPLQVIPEGLLGFFDLKTNGRAPSELAEIVGPSVELRDWYFQSRAEWVYASQNVTANGFYVGAVVPNTEWWYVHHCSVEMVPFTTNHEYQLMIAWYERLQTQLYLGPPERGNSSSASLIPPSCSDRNLWVPPGSTIGFKAATDSIGPFNTLWSCRFTRLQS